LTAAALTLAAAVALGPAADPEAAPPAAAADPDAPTVAAQADRGEARVGDVVVVTVTVIARRGVPVNLPANLDLGPFAVLDKKDDEQDLGDGRVRRRFVLSVAAYEPGDLAVPAVEITYLGRGGEVLSARTEPLPVRITSLLANEPEPALKENAPPVVVWERRIWPAWVAGGIAAAAAGGLAGLALARRLRARAAVVPAAPARPAHEVALEKLDRLGAQGFADGVDHRPFYFGVSEVVREYLGARFGFDALELTTEELVEALRRRAARELVLGEVEGWLAACDLVKFAKLPPTATEARGTLETAIRIVESTRPRPAPQVGAAAAGGAA
jgi:hypothetical protein